jgi:hypothetical protein
MNNFPPRLPRRLAREMPESRSRRVGNVPTDHFFEVPAAILPGECVHRIAQANAAGEAANTQTRSSGKHRL